MDAVFALIGGLAGTAVFAHLHEYLVPLLYDPFNVGQITLADWTGSRPAAVVLLVLIFGLCIGAVNFLWKEKNGGQAQ